MNQNKNKCAIMLKKETIRLTFLVYFSSKEITEFVYKIAIFFSNLQNKTYHASVSSFYILSETRMFRNDYFHVFFKTIVCNSPSKTGFFSMTGKKVIKWMSNGFSIWYLMIINHCFDRFSFLIDVEAFYSFLL